MIDRKKCQKMCADSCLLVVAIFISVLSPLRLDHLAYDSWWRLKCIPLIFSLLSVSANSAFGLGAWNAGQDDLLRFAETATQQSIKSAMMEMHSSVPSPGARMFWIYKKKISEQLTRGFVILGQICDVMAFVCDIFLIVDFELFPFGRCWQQRAEPNSKWEGCVVSSNRRSWLPRPWHCFGDHGFLEWKEENIMVKKSRRMRKVRLNSPMAKGWGSMMFGDGLIKVNDGWWWSVMFDVGRGSFVIADPSAGCLCSQCHRDYPPLGYRTYQLSTRWWNRISCQLPGFSSFFPYFHDNYISCARFFFPEKMPQPKNTRIRSCQRFWECFEATAAAGTCRGRMRRMRLAGLMDVLNFFGWWWSFICDFSSFKKATTNKQNKTWHQISNNTFKVSAGCTDP